MLMRYATHCLTTGTGPKAVTLSETVKMIGEDHAGDAMVEVRLATVEGKDFVVMTPSSSSDNG